MIGFVLGVSITLNVVFIIGIVIFLSVKNNVANKFVKSLEDDEIINQDEVKDFMKDEKVDFSSLLRR